MVLRDQLIFQRSEINGGGIVIFRLEGVLTDTREAYEFLEAVRIEIRRGCSSIIINLRNIRFITSSGIGLLAASWSSSKKSNSTMLLVETPDSIVSILKLVCLWDVFDHFDTESEGIQSATES